MESEFVKRIEELERNYGRITSKIQKLEEMIKNVRQSRRNTACLKSFSMDESHRPESLKYEKNDTESIKRVKDDCFKKGMLSARLKWVPSNYYDLTLEQRRNILGATRYYCCVIQYVSKLNSEKLMKTIRELANANSEGKKYGKNKFNFRLADQKEGEKMTGFIRNAVTPAGMLQSIPVIMSKEILHLTPRYFWMGGGEVDVKLELYVDDFIDGLQPIIADISDPLLESELNCSNE